MTAIRIVAVFVFGYSLAALLDVALFVSDTQRASRGFIELLAADIVILVLLAVGITVLVEAWLRLRRPVAER